MSVFCSETLILAPERWKCIVRGLDFENFPGDMPLECPRNRCKFFLSLPNPKLLPPILKTLLKTLIRNPDSKRKKNKTKGTCLITVQLPSLQKQTFLLPHCCWGTFHEEERLPLSDRNSITFTRWHKICSEFGHKHWLDNGVVTFF